MYYYLYYFCNIILLNALVVLTVSVAAFENSQSDASTLESMRNSSRIEDSLVEEPSPTDTPTSDAVEQPHLNLDPHISTSGFLNHLSQPLPTLEEVNGTPEAVDSTDVPKLLEPNNIDSDELRQSTFQDAELEPEEVVENLRSEVSTEPEVSAEFSESSAVKAELPRRRGLVFVWLLFFGILLVFIVFETDLLVPLASQMGVDTQLHHLRLNYYLPIRRRINFW